MNVTLKVEDGLNINPVAWDILRKLKRRPLCTFESPKFAFMTTAVWYNGRERGFSLVLYSGASQKPFCVVFCESRNSDDVRIWNWEIPAWTINPPQPSKEFGFTERVYLAGHSIIHSNQQVAQAATYIRKVFKAHVAKLEGK